MDKFSDKISMEQLKQLANSPAGKQLLAALQQDKQTLQQVKSGNYDQAMKRLEQFLRQPEAEKLLKELGR